MTAREQLRAAVVAALPDADLDTVDRVVAHVTRAATEGIVGPLQDWIDQMLHRGNDSTVRFATGLATIVDQLEIDLGGGTVTGSVHDHMHEDRDSSR